MIGEALNDEIRKYIVRSRGTNPLFTKAENGSLTPALIGKYLANVHQLILHTPVHLARAREVAAARGEHELSRHFEHKLHEEAGHDAWAQRDREGLQRKAGVLSPDAVIPAMAEIIANIEGLIDRDPSLYLSYIFFMEQITVLMGPEWLSLLETRCGIPKTLMTVIGNHAELDKDHVAEALDQIDALVGDPGKLPAMRAALEGTIERFEAFCVEVTAVESGMNVTETGKNQIAAA